jgi:5-methylcytosine-specific restriction endonuclease McrA
MPTKKPKLRVLKKKLWKLVSISVKMRDNFTCARCGKKDSGSLIHASHILPKGQYHNYEFEEWNLKCLCMKCHLQWWHKNPLEACGWFEKKFPKRYNEVMLKAKQYSKVGKYTSSEIQKRIKQYEGPITW